MDPKHAGVERSKVCEYCNSGIYWRLSTGDTPMAQVPHVDPELSVVAVLRVHAGGPGVDPASAAAELHLAAEEGAGMVVNVLDS